jgi:hypothetical protein
MNLHRNIQDGNTFPLKNDPMNALRWPHPGIPQNLRTMVRSPHKTNFHPQKGMYQRMNEDHVAKSFPLKG